MKLYCKIDTTTGLFIEDVLLDSTPILTRTVTQTITDEQGTIHEVITEQPIFDVEGNTIPDPQYIDVECPAGFYKPKWDGTQWVEGLAQVEIDAIKNVPHEPTEDERISALEDALLYII